MFAMCTGCKELWLSVQGSSYGVGDGCSPGVGPDGNPCLMDDDDDKEDDDPADMMAGVMELILTQLMDIMDGDDDECNADDEWDDDNWNSCQSWLLTIIV